MEPIETIEHYLKGTLTEEQRKFFEYRMEADPELFKQVELHRQTMKAVDSYFLQELKAGLEEVEDEEGYDDFDDTIADHEIDSPTNQEYDFFKISKIMLAAGIALILATVFLWLTRAPNYSEIFAENYEVYPNIEMPIERGNEQQILSAFQNYESGSFSQASSEFESLISNDPHNPAWAFYLANCQMETKLSRLAIDNYLKTIEQGESKYQNPARWYLALAYISSNQVTEAKKQLEILVEVDYGYKEKGAKLLEEL